MPKDEARIDHVSKSSSTKLIRLVWTDYGGVVRCKAIPASQFGSPVRIVHACMVLMPWGPLADGTHIGVCNEVELVPVAKVGGSNWLQWQSQQTGVGHLPSRLELPWHPNHKVAIAKLVKPDGEPWEQCPKSALTRVVDMLTEKGLNVKAGFELEFGLFTVDPTDGKSLKPYGRGANFALFDQFDIAASFIDDVVACLEQMKIPVRLVHAEHVPGQFEVVLGHKDVLEAVQDVVLARMAVKAIARKHNLVASFVPNYGDGLGGSGGHVHLSLDDHFGTEDRVHDVWVGASQTGQMFMAGIVHALPWLTFLANASCLSYVRAQPMFWVGVYQVWGVNNKETPLRLVEDRSNVEFKMLDAVSNVDLALAGVLLAGLRGIEGGQTLPVPCQEDPHGIDERERPARLPDSLERSMEEFRKAHKEEVLKGVFTDEMVHDLICVKKSEIAFVKKNGIAKFREMLMSLH